MGKDRKITVETRFQNGSISFRMSDDRLVKLSKTTIDDLMNLIRPGQVVRGDWVSIAANFWFNSVELITGPGGEQREQWDSEERWKHRPFVSLRETIQILGLLHSKDLTSLADFANEVDFRNSLAYRSWHRQQQGSGSPYVSRNMTSTTVVSEREFEEMKERMAGDEC
jgi:hypothetical protein